MSRKPKVLVVAPWTPVPIDAGSRRVWTACKTLGGRYEFVLAALKKPLQPAPGQDPREVLEGAAAALARESRALAGVFSSVRPVHVPDEPDAVDPAAGWLPDDVRRHHHPAMSDALRELVERERPDLVHLEFDLMAPYVRDLKAFAPDLPVLLTHHDMGSVSLLRSYFREMTGWGRFRRLGEWWRRLLFTRETFRLFDGVVVLTEADRRRLSLLIPSGRIHVVPTGVDLEHYRRPAPRRKPEKDVLVYVGHYPHYPNEEAVLYFAREILPLIRRERPHARFQIVGSGPTRALRALAQADPLIEVTGTVEDVRPYEEAASVMVAPVRLGQGIKGKLLEAFAAGTPVVSNSNANEGVRAAPGKELLVGDSPRAFADAVLRLLSDGDLWSSVSQAARAFVEREHAWSRRAGELDKVYQACLDRAKIGHYPIESARS